MTLVPRPRAPLPIVPSIVALVMIIIAAYVSTSSASQVARGHELSVRGWGFLLLLGLGALLATAFAIMRWAQRRAYVWSASAGEETEHASILIEQEVDQHGQPVPERYRKSIVSTMSFPRTSLAIDALVRLGALPGGKPGEFVYRNGNSGSGSARVEGFAPEEVRAIHDYFRIEAERIRLGLSSTVRLPLETTTYFTRPGTLRNPIPMIVLGFGILVFAVSLGVLTSVGPMRTPGDDITWVYTPLFALLALGGITIIVQHLRRLSSWFALRSSFREADEAMPVGLRLKD